MRLSVIFRYIGIVMLFLALFMLASAGVSYINHVDTAFYPLLISFMLVGSFVGLAFMAGFKAGVKYMEKRGAVL